MRALALIGAALLGGCVSTQMKQYVGQDISEVMIRYGKPVQVIPMPDGRRAYQFRYGGGPVVLPGTAQSTVQAFGNTATVTTTGTPAAIVETKGCLITFIVGRGSRVDETRPPKDAVC